MKRPLCVFAILLTAAVFLCLELFPFVHEDRAFKDADGTYVEVTGRVSSKEIRENYLGDRMPVIYLIPGDGVAGSYMNAGTGYCIQCYLESWDRVPAIGEYVMLGGKVKAFQPPTNPGEFDSCLYYSTLKISYRLSSAEVLKKGGRANAYRESLFVLRSVLEDSLDAVLPEQDSAVMKAMLLGDKSFIDQETKDMYKSSGIMHILAVSGVNSL